MISLLAFFKFVWKRKISVWTTKGLRFNALAQRNFFDVKRDSNEKRKKWILISRLSEGLANHSDRYMIDWFHLRQLFLFYETCSSNIQYQTIPIKKNCPKFDVCQNKLNGNILFLSHFVKLQNRQKFWNIRQNQLSQLFDCF